MNLEDEVRAIVKSLLFSSTKIWYERREAGDEAVAALMRLVEQSRVQTLAGCAEGLLGGPPDTGVPLVGQIAALEAVRDSDRTWPSVDGPLNAALETLRWVQGLQKGTE